jgi:tRNA-dihydrouridine synthase A
VIADEDKTRSEVVLSMIPYARRIISEGNSLRALARHMLGLYHGTPRARLWRRMLSDAAQLKRNDPALLLEALDVVERRGSMMAAA